MSEITIIAGLGILMTFLYVCILQKISNIEDRLRKEIHDLKDYIRKRT